MCAHSGPSPLLLHGLLLTGAWAGLAFLDPLRAHPLGALALYALAFAVYVMALRRMPREAGRWPLWGLLAVALACRLLALPATPSDDVARYLWEARVLAAGENPYLLAPDDPQLAALAATSPEHAGINHPDWPAIYPPVAQLWQALVVAIHPSALALKISFLLVEVGLVVLLLGILRRRGLPDHRIALYAWNPLAILATASEGHHDVLSATLLLAALSARDLRRPLRAGALFALAVLSKGLAVVCAPVFLWRRDDRDPLRARAASWVSAGLVGIALCAPVFAIGGGLLGSFTRFGTELHWNDSAHALAALWLPPRGARALMAAIGLGVVFILWRRDRRDALEAGPVLLGTLLLLLPTLHPWYLVVLLPSLCLTRWWGWIAFTGSVMLTWIPFLEINRTGHWVEWPWLKVPEYAPLAVWLLACAWLARPSAAPRASPPN